MAMITMAMMIIIIVEGQKEIKLSQKLCTVETQETNEFALKFAYSIFRATTTRWAGGGER